MRNKSPFISDALWSYIVTHWMREPEVLRQLREETAQLPSSGLQISADQGQLMTVLTQIAGVRSALEVGVYTGYSSMAVLLGMPADGRLVACDISDEYTQVARRYWKEAGFSDRVELRIGPAMESLQSLIDEGKSGSFDAAFIDADKPNYPGYYEQCLRLVRPGGFILVDNVFWAGRVADPEEQDEGTNQMRAFNEMLSKDERIDLAIIPIGDGLTLARKR